LLTRVYGPIASLTNVQINVMTALVSFDRVFEVLDLKPLIEEKPDAVALPTRDAAGTAPDITVRPGLVPLPDCGRDLARVA
jgi:ATP-binding cassette subfamily B protein